MRLVMTLLVRDEEDIIAANIEFHRALGVDLFLVTDNLSEDRTPEILADFAAQGVLRWTRETSDDYSQHRWVTRMAREAASYHGADWVINNDADEFWLPRTGSLKDALTSVSAEAGGIYVPRFNFVPRPDGPRPFWERLTIRHTASVKSDGTRLPPKAAHRGHPDVQVAQGNHDVTAPALGPVVPEDRIEVLHFPMRTYEQFENKIIKGGRAYGRNTELQPRVGRHWRELYELHRQGGLERWYDDQVLDDVVVSNGIATGSLVEDRRVAEVLSSRTSTLAP